MVAPKLASSVLVVAAFTACAPIVGTSQVAVDEMAAFYSVTATDEGTHVLAQLFRFGPLGENTEGTSDRLRVDGGDALSVTFQGATRALELDEELSDEPFLAFGGFSFVYTATLPVAQTDEELAVVMTRGDGVVLESSVTIPPVAVFAPIADEFSRSDGLTIVGEGDYAGDFLDGSFDAAPCQRGYGSASEEGRLELSFDGETSDAVCEVSLFISRLRFAQGNPQFAESDLEARRMSDPITLRSKP